MRFAFLLAVLVLPSALPSVASAADRPNVLWIYLEDVSRWFGHNGDPVAQAHDLTPRLDALAARGQRWDRFYTTAGVCSATRSAVITGMYQTSIGAHNHRSSRAVFRKRAMGVDGRYDANVTPFDYARARTS